MCVPCALEKAYEEKQEAQGLAKNVTFLAFRRASTHYTTATATRRIQVPAAMASHVEAFSAPAGGFRIGVGKPKASTNQLIAGGEKERQWMKNKRQNSERERGHFETRRRGYPS